MGSLRSLAIKKLNSDERIKRVIQILDEVGKQGNYNLSELQLYRALRCALVRGDFKQLEGYLEEE